MINTSSLLRTRLQLTTKGKTSKGKAARLRTTTRKKSQEPGIFGHIREERVGSSSAPSPQVSTTELVPPPPRSDTTDRQKKMSQDYKLQKTPTEATKVSGKRIKDPPRLLP